jgi:peptidoglycan-N-acetylglucosamine deacetylase
MLNFRNITIVLFIFIVLVIISLLAGFKPGMFPFLALIIYIMVLYIGTVNICMNFWLKAFCKGNTKEKVITLTFDDGPDPDVTPEVLTILKRYKIRAAFFIIGKKAEKHPDLVKRILEERHSIGVHSYSHSPYFDLFSAKKMEQDLLKGIEASKNSVLFRPPFGITNPTVAKVAKRLGFRVVGWSIRSFDTVFKDPAIVAGRIKTRLHPGAIVLMHDTRKDLPLILEEVITFAMDKGYRFVGVEEMMEFETM